MALRKTARVIGDISGQAMIQEQSLGAPEFEAQSSTTFTFRV